ncbi:double-cubane-cluster-containing anaerobic reductase [Oscillibacter sp.]|uniref:double-cubane-cluster-containing anaerobic reductase n=1 Tax=Oscillibacter sp. TaxID=1945593 RepID=UPI0028ABDE8F|nr:double-cubane-cluster-containing anaerobic reductase [Oscillibacter sp.]
MADYREMWKSLGMDLETHDQLCEVLPAAFGDTYLSQENRPEGMAFYDFVVSEIHGVRPAELIDHQKKGGKVLGTFCIFVPDEVVFAADAIATGLCGGSQFWVGAGEKVLPKNMCPLIKASVGARIGKTCPYFRIADMYVGETTCDGKKKAWEILKEEVPIHVMDMPQMKREQDYRKWEDEIRAFLQTVEEFTGNAITPEKLAASIKMLNNKRKALARVFECRKADPTPISGKDALLMMQIAFYDDPVRCAEMANKLADELEQRIKDGMGVFPKGTKRILVTGTPMAIPNWKLHHIIETSGAAVVCEENCTGTRYFENLVDESGTTLDEQIHNLADRYMKNNCACFTPNTGRIDDILRLAEAYHVDGVIDANLKFCTLYDSEGRDVERAMKERGIPVLGLETDYTDTDAEQLRTRIGAFVEMLK